MSRLQDLYQDAMNESLENAKRWIEDAQLLLKAESWGHAYVLSAYALEEIAKASGCQLVAEGAISLDDEFRRRIFREHTMKQLFAMRNFWMYIYNINRSPQSGFFIEIRKRIPDITKDDIVELTKKLEDSIMKNPEVIEYTRQMGIYVDLDEKQMKVTSPKSIKKIVVVDFVKLVNYIYWCFVITKDYLEPVEQIPRE